jgi:hypothetical protein
MTGLCYVQDERYVTDAWMRWSDDVQDERSTTAPALWTFPPSMAVVCHLLRSANAGTSVPA